MGQLLHAEETQIIRGAIFEVYREMGSGFLEADYQECLAKEFRLRNVPYLAQEELKLTYKGDPLLQTYKADCVCFGKIIIELKAVKQLAPEHDAQLLNYLRSTGIQLGLLVNFGSYPRVEIRRRVL